MSDHFCHVEQIKANQSSDYGEWPPSTLFLFIYFFCVAYIDDIIDIHFYFLCIWMTSTSRARAHTSVQAPDCRLQKKKLISFSYWFATYICVLRFPLSLLFSYEWKSKYRHRLSPTASASTNPSIHDDSKCASE